MWARPAGDPLLRRLEPKEKQSMSATASAPAAGAEGKLLALAEQISSQLAEIQSNTVPPPPVGYKAIKAAATAAKAKALKLKEERAASSAALPTTYDKYTEWDARNMCFCLKCASCCCSIVPVCGKRVSRVIGSGFKCHLRSPCSCPTLPKCNCCSCCWPPPCLVCLKCTTVGCEMPFCCFPCSDCKTKCNCCHCTCGCFPMILYPFIKLLCCSNFEKIDENQNVGKPLKEAEIKQVELGAPEVAAMVREGSSAGA